MRTLPLRYPGGKSKAIKTILPFLPPNLTSIASPFFGGGSLELHLAGQGIKVYGYDNYEPLVNFWQQTLKYPEHVADEVEACFYPMNYLTYHSIRKHLYHPQMLPISRAAIYYALNRSSYSGLTQQGGFSPSAAKERHKLSHINFLRKFKQPNVKVSLWNFRKSIHHHRQDFIFADPPYYLDACLYGKHGTNNLNFAHKGLANILKNHARQWLLCYNDCEYIRKLYEGHRIEKVKWTHTLTSKQSNNQEILIFSK